ITSSYLLNLVLRRVTEYVFPLIVFAREFIHTDIELLVARLIFVDYPEPYQRHHYRIIIPSEPMYYESSPLDSDYESPDNFALDEEFPLPQGRSTRLEPTTKTPEKGKSLSKRISGAMTKISRRLFGQKTRPKSQERSRAKSQERGRSKSQERGRSKSQERGRSKSQERGRVYDSEHGGRSPRKPKRLGRPGSSFRSTSVSRETLCVYPEDDKENINEHLYVNLDSLVSSPMQVGRRLRPVASVSALHGRDAKPVALSSSFRSRHPKSIP